MDLGLEAAGFESVGCLETDEQARNTLKLNRPGWSLLQPSDVVDAGREIRPDHLDLVVGQLTLLAGGPPCQPFSMAAQWRERKPGMDDQRGRAVLGMMDLAEAFLPQAILIENVAGFMRGRSSAEGPIRSRLASINERHGTAYQLKHWVLNAADYGVAQNRRRAIAVAFRDVDRNSGCGEPPKPFDGCHLTAWDAIGSLTPAVVPKPHGRYTELLASIPEGENYQYLTARGGGPRVELFGYRTRYWSFLLKLRKDRPAWTLPAAPGPSTGPFHWDNRPLAVEERLALQGFPVDWQLDGTVRDAIRMTGNATPPPLAEAIGRYLSHVLQTGTSPTTAIQIRPTLATNPRGPAPGPSSPAPLPPVWRAQVGPKDAHPGRGLGPAGHRPDDPST